MTRKQLEEDEHDVDPDDPDEEFARRQADSETRLAEAVFGFTGDSIFG